MKTTYLLTTQSLSFLLYKKNITSLPVVLCIGTDRIIGDSLGPLTGSILSKALPALPVYGTLENTVHALNLKQVNKQIKKKHPHSLVIAVDASLGSCEHIHSVFVRSGSILPGSGVSKSLPSTGDIAITGIVNTESSHPYLTLQTSRLSIVAEMAWQIADCLLQVLTPYCPSE